MISLPWEDQSPTGREEAERRFVDEGGGHEPHRMGRLASRLISRK